MNRSCKETKIHASDEQLNASFALPIPCLVILIRWRVSMNARVRTYVRTGTRAVPPPNSLVVGLRRGMNGCKGEA